MSADCTGKARRDIELLAPAGNLEIGIAAVDHGADAVYVGAPRFGARQAAANSIDDIEKLARYAHRFRARVYVALNTLLDDDEIEAAAQLIRHCYDAGADAMIIQDLGLLECSLPPIPLHASTQCDNRSPEKVRFLESVGFTQVVLARELSLERIREICGTTGVVVECFVHGALCVSYSGRCYISEAVAGRSANRGECAQFCRHRYCLKDRRGKVLVKDRHLLSLRDLDLSGHLSELLDAGVRSLKIEGRLKDIAYVKNVTAAYRLALDRLIEERQGAFGRASSGICRFGFVPDTVRTFQRGKTSYFLLDPENKTTESRTPKAIGQHIGAVISVQGRELTVDTDEVLANGDGLCYFDAGGELRGFKVNRAEGTRITTRTPVAVAVGTELFRNHDAAFVRQLENSSRCRTIRTAVAISEASGTLRFAVTDEDSIHSELEIPVGPEKAQNPERTKATILRQAVKTGETIFEVTSCTADCPFGYHISAAEINRLRRQAFEKHEIARQRSRQRPSVVLTAGGATWPRAQADWRDNITNSRAEAFFRRHGVRSFSGLGPERRGQLGGALMTTRLCLRNQLDSCPQKGCAGLEAEPLYLTDNTGTYELSFDCRRCEMTVRFTDDGPPA